VEILFPPGGVRASLADDKGLVVRFSTQSWSLLYTADAGYPTERWLLEHRPEQLHADVWVRGNHAREVTGTDAFVEAVNPGLIVVSGASFGQDSQGTRRWAEHWRARGKAVWLQQETGAIEGWGGTERRARAFLNGRELRW
jgi:beta-lactamase superfamily II metal-dependent hydrolase